MILMDMNVLSIISVKNRKTEKIANKKIVIEGAAWAKDKNIYFEKIYEVSSCLNNYLN